jgi:hypothetical protein
MIPFDQKFHTVPGFVQTQEKGSALANSQREIYTMQDIISTIGSLKLFAQTSNSIPVTATTVETTVIDGGVGTLSVPANGFQVGDSFSAILSGIISSANNETIRIKVKSGSIILGDSGLISLPTTTNKHWDLQIHFTVRSIGGPGVAQIMTSGALTYSKNSSNAFEGQDFSSLNNNTFNTTVPNTLDITVQWGSNNAGNSIYTQTFVLHKTY